MARIITLALVCFFVVLGANAEQLDGPDQKLVVLVSMKKCCPEQSWSEAEKAAIEELQTVDLRIKIVDGKSSNQGEWRDELGAITADNGADCAIRIYRSSDGRSSGVDLWIAEEAGEFTFRHIPLGRGTDSEAVAIAALRASEAVRAELLSWPIENGQVGGETSDSSNSEEGQEGTEGTALEMNVKPKGESPPEFGVGLGVGAAGAPSGAGVLGVIDLSLEWNPLPLLSFEIDGVLSVIGRDVEQGDEGSSFDFALIRAWAHLYFLKSGRLRPSLGLGGGIAFSWSEGRGSTVLAAEKDRTQVAYLGASGRLALVLTRNIWLVTGARVGFFVPEVEVNFANDQAATFGRPLIEGFLNLEVRFL